MLAAIPMHHAYLSLSVWSGEIVRLSECSTTVTLADYRLWYHWPTWAQLGIHYTSASISCLHPCPSPPGLA